MNIGYIYKITNLINGKMYVGQTTKTIEERFRHHKNDCFRKNKSSYNYPLYNAMRKYGIENFEIEELECCDISLLDEREIFWIKFFNTFYNGYNATLGGKGGHTLNLDEKIIVEKYKKYGTMKKVAKEYNCSKDTIKNILMKHNICITPSTKHAKNKGLTVQRFSKTNVLLEEYTTLVDAGQWAINNNLTKSTIPRYAGMSIKRAIIENKSCFGFIWKSDFYNDEIKEKRKIKMNSYIRKKTSEIYKDTCPLCNKNKKSINSIYCKECFQKIKSEQFAKELEQKISREELKQLIRTTPFTKIGEQFGVSDNAIRKWCTRYGLPAKSLEIKKYTNEEWKNI